MSTAREREVVGIDTSLDNIERARARNSAVNVHYVLCDGKLLPFRENAFDFVFTIGTLHHISPLGYVIREISRVLKRNGSIIGMEPNIFHPHATSLGSSPSLLRVFTFLEKGEKPINPRDLVRVLEGNGFRLLHTEFALGLKFLVGPLELILKPTYCLRVYEFVRFFDVAVPSIVRNSFSFVAKKEGCD